MIVPLYVNGAAQSESTSNREVNPRDALQICTSAFDLRRCVHRRLGRRGRQVTLSRRHRSDARQLVVSIANTERRLLQYVLVRVGAGKITRKRVAAAHHTPSCAYSISNRQALSLLQQLAPFLQSHKRERAQLVVAEYLRVVPRNGKSNPIDTQLRREFEDAFFAITSRCFNGSEQETAKVERQ